MWGTEGDQGEEEQAPVPLPLRLSGRRKDGKDSGGYKLQDMLARRPLSASLLRKRMKVCR